jgi:putative RecB family exonuclease
LLFRFRTIDRLPERPTPDQVRGTLVHAVLERLFDLPAAERTPEAAAALVAPQWARLLEDEPALEALFEQATAPPAPAPAAAPTGSADAQASPAEPPAGPTGAVAVEALPGLETAGEAERLAAFLAGASDLLSGYFAVEDPQRLEPAERESLVSTLVDEELLIRGYIDRLDVSPAGDLRVVDYKTGGAPREAFEGRALFQLKFYALVLWRTRGVVPRVLRLLYLKDAEICDYSPDAAELERFERTLVALSQAIERAKREKDFRPKPSRLCGWCSYHQFCPEFGGTPPPYPEPQPAPAVTADDTATASALTVPAPAGRAPAAQAGSSPAAQTAPAPATPAGSIPAGSIPAGSTPAAQATAASATASVTVAPTAEAPAAQTADGSSAGQDPRQPSVAPPADGPTAGQDPRQA